MSDLNILTRAELRTPKAAAIAGIAFSVSLVAAFWLLRLSVPADPADTGQWIMTDVGNVALALNMIPFSGVAFLWFIGVIRDRLGQREDRFFATVLLGSGLLFLGLLFMSAAAIGSIVLIAATQSHELVNTAAFRLVRSFAYILLNVYAIKMAAVFMISISTVAIFTAFVPKWIAYLGYALALMLLVGSFYVGWSFLVLPFWVLLVSIYILVDNYRGDRTAEA